MPRFLTSTPSSLRHPALVQLISNSRLNSLFVFSLLAGSAGAVRCCPHSSNTYLLKRIVPVAGLDANQVEQLEDMAAAVGTIPYQVYLAVRPTPYQLEDIVPDTNPPGQCGRHKDKMVRRTSIIESFPSCTKAGYELIDTLQPVRHCRLTRPSGAGALFPASVLAWAGNLLSVAKIVTAQLDKKRKQSNERGLKDSVKRRWGGKVVREAFFFFDAINFINVP